MSTRWDDALSEIPSGRLAILCIGNELRADDGVGPLVAGALRERFPGRVFDGGQAPESFVGPVRRARPDVVALVDAADFGGAPGEVRVLSTANLAGAAPGVAPVLGTHAPDLPVLVELIAGATGASVWLIAIQARSTGMGEAMTPEVTSAAQTLASELSHLLEEGEA